MSDQIQIIIEGKLIIAIFCTSAKTCRFYAMFVWELTRARAALVNTRALAERARAMEVGRFLKLGRSEQRTGGESKDTVLADCFEASISATTWRASCARWNHGAPVAPVAGS